MSSKIVQTGGKPELLTAGPFYNSTFTNSYYTFSSCKGIIMCDSIEAEFDISFVSK